MTASSDPSGALVLGIGAGVWLFFKGFRVFREYKVVADTPRMPIRSLPMGFVHIRGKAETEQILTSPVSHSPCCFYNVVIDRWERKDRSSEWKHVCTDADGHRFFIVDDTGKVLVDAHSAEYDLPETAQCTVDSASSATTGPSVASSTDLLKYISFAQMHSMTDNMSQWIDKRFEKAGAGDNPQLQAKREALREFFQAIPAAAKGGQPNLEVIEKLANVSGPLNDPEKEQKRQQFLERLHQAEAISPGGLAVQMPASSPATGRYRLREYLVLPGQDYQVSGTCMENPSPANALERSILVKGHNEPTFLISSKTEAGLRSGLRSKALLSVAGGAALALVCLALLLAHLGLF